MRSRLLIASAAVAALAAIAPFGRAATTLCGGTAPAQSSCTVEALQIGTDNPALEVTAPYFVGVVTAQMTGASGWTKISCTYSLDADGLIDRSCVPTRDGIIFKGEAVNVTATATGKPGVLPAVGSWSVAYRVG